MRISDWSSDVCSSDLIVARARGPADDNIRATMNDRVTRHSVNDLAKDRRLGAEMRMNELVRRRGEKRHLSPLHHLTALEIIGPIGKRGRTVDEEPMTLRVAVQREPEIGRAHV